MFGKKIARILDSTAAAASKAGEKVAGERGADAADRLMNATFGGLRAATGEPCTRTDCTDCG